MTRNIRLHVTYCWLFRGQSLQPVPFCFINAIQRRDTHGYPDRLALHAQRCRQADTQIDSIILANYLLVIDPSNVGRNSHPTDGFLTLNAPSLFRASWRTHRVPPGRGF